MTTARTLSKKLTIQHKTLALAESCTGGRISHQLTNIEGSSQFLKYAVVAYSNEAKTKILKVPSQLIDKYGAVSEEVCIAMAQGARKILQTDFGIGVTGIAGPTGGTPQKPVGLVYISVVTKDESLCLQCQFEGTRSEIKAQTTQQAFRLLSEFL